MELYDKEEFSQNGIELKFLQTDNFKYKQYDNSFVLNLSIIDVMMFNSIEEVKKMLEKYKLL